MCFANCAVPSIDNLPTVAALTSFGIKGRMQPGLLLKLDPERVVRVEDGNAAAICRGGTLA